MQKFIARYNNLIHTSVSYIVLLCPLWDLEYIFAQNIIDGDWINLILITSS